jgi:hypothetical protein
MKLQYKVACLLAVLLTTASETGCAQAANPPTFTETSVMRATGLPSVLTKLVTEYDGSHRLGLKKQLPRQYFDCLLACGLLVHVTRDGKLTTRNLTTGTTVKTQELFSQAEKERYCTELPTALPDGRLVIPIAPKDQYITMIKVVDPTTGRCTNIPSASTGSVNPRYTLLPNNELALYAENDSRLQVFDLETGERRERYPGKHGYSDIVVLPDQTVAKAYGNTVKFSRPQFFSIALNEQDCIDRVAALSKNKLALAAHDSCSKDAYLELIDPVAQSKPERGAIIFPKAERLDLVALSSNTVAARTHGSGKACIIEFGENNTFICHKIPASSRAKSIQSLPNGDLFIVYTNYRSQLWGQSPDMSFYEQAGGKRKKKKAWVLV